MTTPLSHGYPDWGRYAARATKLYVNQNNQALNATVTRGPFFVGDVNYLAYIFDAFGTTGRFNAEYYLDAAASVFLGDQQVDVAVDGGFDFSLPVQGPFVLFRISPISATGTFDLVVYDVGGPLTNLRGNATNNILISTNSTVNAGATNTFSAVRTYPGEAHWFTESAVATWTSRVEVVDANGTATIIDEFRKTTAGDDGRQIFLPAAPCRILINNQSAGAGSFRAALLTRPLEPGR